MKSDQPRATNASFWKEGKRNSYALFAGSTAGRRWLAPKAGKRLFELAAALPAHLSAMTQIVIGEHAGHHGLADGDGANADAGIVAALGDDLGFLPLAVHGAAGRKDR